MKKNTNFQSGSFNSKGVMMFFDMTINKAEILYPSNYRIFKRKIKQIIFLLFMALYSFVCYSQTDSILKKESPKFVLSRFNLYLSKESAKYSIPALNHSLEPVKSKSRYTLYDSPSKGMLFYDNSRHEYFPVNQSSNIYKYDNINRNYNLKDELISGSLDYLIRLIDKDNKVFTIIK